MIKTLKLCLAQTVNVLKGKYRWMLILYVLWLYRVDFMPDTGGGIEKAIQIITLFGLFFLVYRYCPNVLRKVRNGNSVASSFFYLYLFALASIIWSILPMFSGFLAFQNIVLLFAFVWMFSLCQSFESLEKTFLIFTVMTILFESIVLRFTYQPWLFVHYLPAASSAALCVSYCSGELLSMRKSNPQRRKLLRNCIIICLTVLVTSTSGGANASAIFGISIASILSGKIWIGAIFMIVSVFLYLNREHAESLLYFIMPGKTKADIETATGRSRLWDIMMDLAAKRPWFGYGFGCIERAATQTQQVESPDAHNNYLGLYGSLGYIGSAIAYIHFAIFFVYTYMRRKMVGFVGIISAFGCALMNGYSFGFLSGKACSITVVYIELVVLTVYYVRFSVKSRTASK